MQKLNAHVYWIERHKVKTGLATVGLQNSSQENNYWLYKIVLEQYEKIFPILELSAEPLVLDAGCGIGIFVEFFLEKGCQVTVADISPEAIANIKHDYDERVKTICSSLARLESTQRFDIVHCFDVLYHIIDDREWAQTLERFAALSTHYIILHERFLQRKPIITASHVKFRPYAVTVNKLKALGFVETATIPTHFLASRIFTYFWAKYFPEIFYQMDKKILDYCVRCGRVSWGAYHIKVFEKTSKD